MSDDMKTIAESLTNLDDETVKSTLKKAIDSGVDVETIIKDGLGKGMEEVGQRYENGEFFLSELIMAATIMDEAMVMVKPLLKYDKAKKGGGKIVIGTVQGDMHDIGKNIVIAMLESAGFEVIDLGVDVAPEKFVATIKEEKPDLVSMSVLLTATVDKVQETIDAIKASGIRDVVKILVGGRAIDDQIGRKMGADSYGEDAWDAVKKAKALVA